MGAVVARGAPAGILILAIRRSAKKQAERSAQPVETKDEHEEASIYWGIGSIPAD